MTLAWIVLLIAGLCEVIWAVGLKKYGLSVTSLGGLGTIALVFISFSMLAYAMRTLPLGTSYAVWTGIGAAGAALFGIAYAGESADWRRLLCIALIIAGVAGLKVLSTDH